MKMLFIVKKPSIIKAVLAFALLFHTSVALSSVEEVIQENIKKNLPHYDIESITLHDKSSLYIVQLKNGPSLHATPDGKYFLVGDLYRVEESGLVNETEEAKLVKVESLPDSEMVVFAAKNEKAHVSVFTDITCGYCRMLHTEVEKLNELGITVRYLAYPRGGVNSDSYEQMVNIWCSDDPEGWMTKAKAGSRVPDNKCANPVASQYSLGQSLGVRGTPTLVLSTGALIPGYLPADRLAEELGL